jgi:hypothetical protein
MKPNKKQHTLRHIFPIFFIDVTDVEVERLFVLKSCRKNPVGSEKHFEMENEAGKRRRKTEKR